MSETENVEQNTAERISKLETAYASVCDSWRKAEKENAELCRELTKRAERIEAMEQAMAGVFSRDAVVEAYRRGIVDGEPFSGPMRGIADILAKVTK